MGAESITVLFWGVPLPDDRADIAYGLAERYEGVGFAGATRLPGDTKPAKVHSRPAWPREAHDGRHWIGVVLSGRDATPLPKVMRGAVFPIVDAGACVDLPECEVEPKEAKAAWSHFADWCTRRGWAPPEPGLYVVADYD